MAVSTRLTNKVILATRPAKRDRWLTDDSGERGSGRLQLRITPQGSRRFYFRYSIAGKATTLPLGRYSEKPCEDHLTLEQARERARELSRLHRAPDTRDVKASIHASIGAAKPAIKPPGASSGACTHTLLDLANAYVEDLRRRGRESADQNANYIKNHVAPTEWALIPASQVTLEQAAGLVRRIVDAGKGTTARHVRSCLRAAYQLAIRSVGDPRASGELLKFSIQANVFAAVDSMSDLKKAGERALTARELGWFWCALKDSARASSIACGFLRLDLQLGGQRCIQLLRCTLSSVDRDEETITLHDGKGRRSQLRVHVLPLIESAIAECDRLAAYSMAIDSTFLFAGKKKGKALHDSTVTHTVEVLSRELLAAGKVKAAFTYADIRRTCETRMAAIGIHKDVRAQVQSHGLGDLQARHYDRHDYMQEKREALERLFHHLEECERLALSGVPTASGAAPRLITEALPTA